MIFVEFTKRENNKRILIELSLVGSVHENVEKGCDVGINNQDNTVSFLVVNEDYDTVMKRIAEACHYA